MKTSIILSLEKRRVKKDGTMMIVYRITHNRLTTVIPSGFRVTLSGWDEKKRKIKSSYKGLNNITRINNLLEKTKAKYIDDIAKLHEDNELNFLSTTELKERLTNKVDNQSFFNFTLQIIKELKEQKRIGNARSYTNTLREIKQFRKSKDFTFNELNYSFLEKFETYYLKKGNSINGLAVYMRTIRAIYNKAIKQSIASADAYPFKLYRIKSIPTKKRAISMDAISKIVALNYTTDDVLFRTRNIFLMSFYLMGAPYSDLAHLKLSNIVDGRIQ
jgi:predicted DNA binding CopG/RHH family protein